MSETTLGARGGATTTALFDGLRIDYDETMLAPRDWTLAQAEWGAALDLPDGPVLELCAGAGHLGLAVVRRLARPLVAVDLNPSACAHLRRNADRAGLGDRVEVREGRVEEVLADHEQFALVIADPPWVPSARVPAFPEDPVHTIDGGADGLSITWHCVEVIDEHLLPAGAAVLQLGSSDQVDAVRERLAAEHPTLVVTQVREHGARGVLALLRRRCAAGTGR